MKTIWIVLAQRTRWLAWLIVLTAILSGCIVPPASAPTGAPTAPTPTAPAVASSEVTTTTTAAAAPADNQAVAFAPAGSLEKYKDIDVGFTVEGYPFRGSPDAPVMMVEYSDFQCPFCSRYFVQTEPAINDSFVRSGQLRVVFRDFPIVGLHPNAPAAHTAASCVADQGSAAQYWAMHDQLFQTQAVWSNMSDPAAHFVQLAETVGADLTHFNECYAKNDKQPLIDEALNEGQQLGINGTPSFNLINTKTQDHFLLVGAQPYDQFAGIIDALAKGEQPAQAEQPSEGNNEIPFWATADGLKPDPANPGYTVAGDEYRGNPDAKVVVIEFSDFQCPYCRRHTEETQPALDKTFVETDQIFWVFKHFPLNIHPQARAAGIAAECAANQGKFWEMHGLLFSSVESWSVSDPSAVFTEMAKQVDLKTDEFSACLDDPEAAKRVDSDQQDGAQFVNGTPTFIVLYGQEGRIIPGALPVDRFTQALQQVVDSAQ